MNRRTFLRLGLLSLGLAGCGKKAGNGKPVLRVGHFPNVTHAQGVIASQMSRDGKGWFEERLGPGVEIQWFSYNAGPAAMEGIFADSIDLTYVGPSPVLNAYAKAAGEEVRVIAGAAVGGAGLVVQGVNGAAKPADFRGKKVATPQYGNTQDIACRVWLRKQGFSVTQAGGDVQVLPTPNPDQLALFQRKEIDAAWTVEPWISRLELEAGGNLFLEQKEEVITVLASSVTALNEKAELVKKFVAAHAELTEWVGKNTEEAKALVKKGVAFLTHTELPPGVLDRAWPRLHFTSQIERASFENALTEAQSVGFLKDSPKLDRLMAVAS
jgi:NitT/TauT family transport system substrate-binding protein